MQQVALSKQISKPRSCYVVISTFIKTIRFRFYDIKNRVLMGSMHVGLEEAPGGYERMAAFYAERAKGDVGLIVTGGIAPNQAGLTFAHASKLDSTEEAEKHKVITEAVHAAGGRLHYKYYIRADILISQRLLRLRQFRHLLILLSLKQ